MRFVNVGKERASIRRRWKFHWCSLAMAKMLGSLALPHCVNSSDMRRYRSADRSTNHTHVLVRATIIEKPTPSIAHESLHKHYIRYLSDFFPFGPWRKNGCLSARENLGRIIFVKKDPTSRVNIFVVCAVIDQENAFSRQERRRAWFHNLRIKRAGAAGENRMIKGLRPMEQVFGVGDAHLGVLATRIREKIHPIFAIDFLRDDCAGLRPFHIPLALVSRKDNALPLPVDQVGRRGETELRILFIGTNSIYVVVSRICQIKSIAKFDQPGVFDSTALFIRRLRNQYRFRPTNEVKPVIARGVAKR